EVGHQHVGHGAGLRRRTGHDLDALQRAMSLRHLTLLLTGHYQTIRAGTFKHRMPPWTAPARSTSSALSGTIRSYPRSPNTSAFPTNRRPSTPNGPSTAIWTMPSG